MKEFNTDKPKAKIIERFNVNTWVEIIFARWYVLDEEQQYNFCDPNKIESWLRNGYSDYYEYDVVQKSIEKFLSIDKENTEDL